MFQKVAAAACAALIVLIFVGAIVRASGAGMGCPDWPTCWGCLIPPTNADQIDPAKLDIEKYRIKAAAHGIDPETITKESIIANYNPLHTWIEYINRLTSMPLSLLTLATFIMALTRKRHIRSVVIMSTIALLLLGINGWMGARIVYSGLKPGIITIHMALAIAMLCVLVFVAWRGCDSPWRLAGSSCRGGLNKLAWFLFVLVLTEGVLGSQIREKTDELKKSHAAAPRSEWVGELEHSATYLIHRSASWVILIVAVVFFLKATAARTGASWLEKVILGAVLCQMVLGLILAQVGILPFAQVLHIGLSSILVSALFLWLLASSRMDLRPWNG
ncbi:COX15/CtaA family protein [Verrucomicrobiaceae bacterium 5K15]|uniref:COX15/CtaA family protein n=1 Tax=Oceaniferula flava TaxID=2800421 RepID=A0AAE2V7H8_9BACT|nr:COX15/CtaA family protein [Oceaniferula flavus]MBK1853797.1 COX15/CtaA family protein [Oceaniferula flavus]MBM1135103.1 COX15/CtaA family protein [Oceaniferula flavus]